MQNDWLSICIPLVAHFEGCAKRVNGLVYPYLDRLAKSHVWTRGYGRTYGITESSPPITLEQAQSELGEGLNTYAAKVLKLAPILAEKPACLAAVVSWSWNCGVGAFQRSRLRKAINDERWDDAAELIKKPNTAGGVVYAGLTRRRNAEFAIFKSGLQ
jgi:lysozyme